MANQFNIIDGLKEVTIPSFLESAKYEDMMAYFEDHNESLAECDKKEFELAFKSINVKKITNVYQLASFMIKYIEILGMPTDEIFKHVMVINNTARMSYYLRRTHSTFNALIQKHGLTADGIAETYFAKIPLDRIIAQYFNGKLHRCPVCGRLSIAKRCSVECLHEYRKAN